MKEENRNIFKKLKKFKVTEVRKKRKGYINPVIVTFQNGEINEKHVSECEAILTPNTNGQTDVEIRTTSDQVFKDSHFHNKGFPKQSIAIINKKTNKVKIVEVDSAVLINSALLSSPNPATETTTTATTTETNEYVKDLRTLHKTFGGKKVVTRLEQREKLNLSSLPIADEVKKVVEVIKVEENISLNNTEMESMIHILPPCHRDAKVLSDIYILNEIISDEELVALKQELNSMEESKSSIKENSQFFHECVKEAKKSKENLDDRLAGILFAECLMKFLKIPSKKISSKTAIFCPFSSLIHEKLLNEFCVKTETSVNRPLTMRDKCLCYIITLGLICCNYQINLKLLSLITAVHFNRLTRLARIVGAVPFSKDGNLFILKVPLPALPKLSKGKVNRR